MRVAGVDLSTFSVDVVTVPLDEGKPLWHRFPLTGQDAFDRARSVADAMPARHSVFWDEILAVGIEEPAGKNPGRIFRVQGAILSQIPPRMLVEKLMPSAWRKSVGLKGNCSKDEVRAFAQRQHRSNPGWVRISYRGSSAATSLIWPQDACDAYCIALATRSLIEQKQAA